MATTTRKPSSVRRLEIARAALAVIGERGATSLTAATLAREVGLTPGALFRHFASLDDILEAAVDVAIEAVDATLPQQDLPPIERLRTLALRRIELIGGTPGLTWLLLSDQVYLCVPDAAVARLRALVKRSKVYLLAAFQQGIEEGALRADLQPGTMLPIFTGTVHSLIMSRGVHKSAAATANSPTPIRVLDALLALLANP
jgi:AcrR family transcriptional regulator